jgi:hypothetical protein
MKLELSEEGNNIDIFLHDFEGNGFSTEFFIVDAKI